MILFSKNRNIVLAIMQFVCFLQMNCIAQKDALVADIKLGNLAYQKAPSMVVTMNYKLYKSYTEKTPKETYSGLLKRKGDLFYSKLLGTETVSNNTLLVSVLEEEKMILIGKAKKQVNLNTAPSIDTMLKICASVKLIETTADAKTYELDFGNKNIEYQKIRVSYNIKNHFLSKLVLYYRVGVNLNEKENNNKEFYPDTPVEKPRLEIVYQTKIPEQVLSNEEFSEKKYIVKDKKEYKGIGVYKNYRIVDQTDY